MSKMITLRLSEERLERVDEVVARGVYRTRAAALRAALDRMLVEEEERRIDEAIVEGYTRIPPTPEEEAMARASTYESVADEPW